MFNFLKKFKRAKKSDPSKIELPAYKHMPKLKLLTITIAILLLFTFVWTISFSYSRVNKTLGQSEEFFFLQSELGVEPIDFAILEEVKIAWEAKISNPMPTISRNPYHRILLFEVDEVENAE